LRNRIRANETSSAREAQEEAGLALELDLMLPISRWITPEISPKRFDTWFFVAPLRGEVAVRVDGGEIQRHRRLSPREALALHGQKSLRLAPPTFGTVTTLAAYDRLESAQRGCSACKPPTFRPRIVRLGEGAVMLYPGDAGYDAQDADRPGARHRLWALAEGWRYERTLAGVR